MKYKNDIRLFIRLFTLIIIGWISSIIIYVGAYEWMLLLVPLTILLFYYIFCKYRDSENNIKLLLEAIKNGDYTYRVNDKSTNKIVINAINSIVEILYNEKLTLEEREQYFELLLDGLTTGIIVIDNEWKVSNYNKAVTEILDKEVILSVDALNEYDNLGAVLKEMKSGDKRLAHININGIDKNILIRMNIVKLKGKDYNVYSFNDIHTEIDGRELDSWVKLTHVLTHELLNGIAPISSISHSLMKDTSCSDARVVAGIEAISETVDGLMKLVDAYRQFNAVPLPVPKLVYVKELIKHCVDLIPEYEIARVKIETEAIPNNLIVYADPSMITQVIVNILKNAVYAVENGGIIRIKAYNDKNDVVRIKILNNGPYISDDIAEDIFVPFFTTKPEGNGIGLSISRKIMIHSNGTLELERYRNERFTTCFVLSFN